MNTQHVMTTRKLTKSYGAVKALNEFSVQIVRGEFVALLGANGAGKSTFIRVVLGLESADAPPNGGESDLLGCANGALSPAVKERLGYISDDAGPMPWASATDLARFYSRIYAAWDADYFQQCTAQWKLDARRRLKDLSKGQRRLTEFALTLSCKPDLLVLDEPFNGLDAVNRIELRRILSDLQSNGTTILYTTHVLEEVESVADRIIIIKSGRKIVDSPLRDLGDSVETVFRTHYGV